MFIGYPKRAFVCRYDGAKQQSRIDYYGGMVKTYQLPNQGDFGKSLKMAPITTENALNAVTCLEVNGTSDMKITPQTILPDLTGFQCHGEEIILGLPAEKWQMTSAFGAKTNKYTMWVRYKKDPNQSGESIPIPLRYEMRGFNSLLGSHYDHYYLEYDYFSNNDIADEVFQIDDSKLFH